MRRIAQGEYGPDNMRIREPELAQQGAHIMGVFCNRRGAVLLLPEMFYKSIQGREAYFEYNKSPFRWCWKSYHSSLAVGLCFCEMILKLSGIAEEAKRGSAV